VIDERLDRIMWSIVHSGDCRTINTNKIVTKDVTEYLGRLGYGYDTSTVRTWLLKHAPDQCISHVRKSVNTP